MFMNYFFLRDYEFHKLDEFSEPWDGSCPADCKAEGIVACDDPIRLICEIRSLKKCLK